MAHADEQLEALLSDYVDDTLADTDIPRVHQALAADARLADLVEQMRNLRQQLGDLPRPAAPGDLVEEVESQLERSALLGEHEPSRAAAPWGQWRAVAAVLLLMLGLAALVYNLLPGPAKSPSQFAIERPVPTPAELRDTRPSAREEKSSGGPREPRRDAAAPSVPEASSVPTAPRVAAPAPETPPRSQPASSPTPADPEPSERARSSGMGGGSSGAPGGAGISDEAGAWAPLPAIAADNAGHSYSARKAAQPLDPNITALAERDGIRLIVVGRPDVLASLVLSAGPTDVEHVGPPMGPIRIPTLPGFAEPVFESPPPRNWQQWLIRRYDGPFMPTTRPSDELSLPSRLYARGVQVRRLAEAIPAAQQLDSGLLAYTSDAALGRRLATPATHPTAPIGEGDILLVELPGQPPLRLRVDSSLAIEGSAFGRVPVLGLSELQIAELIRARLPDPNVEVIVRRISAGLDDLVRSQMQNVAPAAGDAEERIDVAIVARREATTAPAASAPASRPAE